MYSSYASLHHLTRTTPLIVIGNCLHVLIICINLHCLLLPNDAVAQFAQCGLAARAEKIASEDFSPFRVWVFRVSISGHS